MDPLLFQHSKTATVTIARHDPLGAVMGQPALGRLDVHAHAGQAAGCGGADGIGVVDLTGIEATEHGDGEIRHVAEGGDRLALPRVHVGEKVVQAVRRGVRVGRHHDVVLPPPRAAVVVPSLMRCPPSTLPDQVPPTWGGRPGQ